MNETEYVVVVPHRFLQPLFDKLIVLGMIVATLVIVGIGLFGAHSISKAAHPRAMTPAEVASEYKGWTYDQWQANPSAQLGWCQDWLQDPASAQHELDHLSSDPIHQIEIEHTFRYLLDADCPSILSNH